MTSERFIFRLISDELPPGGSAVLRETLGFPILLGRVSVPRELADRFVMKISFGDEYVTFEPVPAVFYAPHQSGWHGPSGLAEAKEQFDRAWSMCKDGGGGAMALLLGMLLDDVQQAQARENERLSDVEMSKRGRLDCFVAAGKEIAVAVTNRSDRAAPFVCVLEATRIATERVA